MSKQVWSMNENMGNSRQTVQSHQPHWMAHWMRTSSNAMTTVEGDFGSRGASSKGSGNEGMFASQAIRGQGTDEVRARRPIISPSLEGGMQLSSGVLAANENSSREYRFIGEGTSKKPLDWMKGHLSAKEQSSSSSVPSQDRFAGPSTHMVPYHNFGSYKLDKGKAVACPLISRPSVRSSNEAPDTKLRITGEEHGHKHLSSADLIWERKMSSLSKPEPKSGQDWFQMMEKSSHVTSLIPSRCIAPETNERKVAAAGYESYPLQTFPSCVREMMKICTTVDSVEALPGGSPWFSKTTHRVLITKKTDVSVSKEPDMFRRFISQAKGNSSGDLENIPSFFGQASRGVKLQPISSNDSEWKRNVGNVDIGAPKAASRNESSAETDIMSLEFPKEERPNSGANSTHSTKVFNFDSNLSAINVAPSRNVGRGGRSSWLPDINLEPPPLAAAAAVASSSDDIPSSSRTQSLEMDMLLSHAQPKSNLSPPKPDPSARWVKRLKTSSDSSAQGTKTLNLSENSFHEKKGAIFRSIFKKGTHGSIPTGKETILSDVSANSSKEDKHLSPDPPKKSKEVLLSQVWIKRWLSNESQNCLKKDKVAAVCEPQNSKSSSLDDLRKKQFPSTSIAAVALMGKSMPGFQSCEVQKRGSFTVWNSKAF